MANLDPSKITPEIIKQTVEAAMGNSGDKDKDHDQKVNTSIHIDRMIEASRKGDPAAIQRARTFEAAPKISVALGTDGPFNNKRGGAGQSIITINTIGLEQAALDLIAVRKAADPKFGTDPKDAAKDNSAIQADLKAMLTRTMERAAKDKKDPNVVFAEETKALQVKAALGADKDLLEQAQKLSDGIARTSGKGGKDEQLDAQFNAMLAGLKGTNPAQLKAALEAKVKEMAKTYKDKKLFDKIDPSVRGYVAESEIPGGASGPAIGGTKEEKALDAAIKKLSADGQKGFDKAVRAELVEVLENNPKLLEAMEKASDKDAAKKALEDAIKKTDDASKSQKLLNNGALKVAAIDAPEGVDPKVLAAATDAAKARPSEVAAKIPSPQEMGIQTGGMGKA